jgi:type I restriction enzyme S subunit
MIEYKLEELLKIKNGRDYKHLNEGTIPVYGSGGLMRHVDETLYEGKSILLPRKGTLSNIQYVNEAFWTVDTIYYSIVDESKAEPYYLYNYIKLLDLNHLNTGTGVPSMTFGAYYDVPIKLPNLSIQKQVAKVLSDLDSKIEINNKINQELEAMAKTLYDYWFVQFDFPDVNGNPYKSSGGKMVFNEALKREIPEGWEDGLLGSIGKVSMCKRVMKSETSSNGEIPFFKISTFGGKANTFISRDLFNTYREKYSYPKRGDILISAAGTIGKTVIFDGQKSYFQDSNIVWIDNDESKIPNCFLYYYYQKEPWVVTGGSTIKRLYNDNIRNLNIIFPSLNVLKDFSKLINLSLEKQQKIVSENQKLSELRDWLLPMLMNGQVTVGSLEKEIEGLGLVAEGGVKYEKG